MPSKKGDTYTSVHEYRQSGSGRSRTGAHKCERAVPTARKPRLNEEGVPLYRTFGHGHARALQSVSTPRTHRAVQQNRAQAQPDRRARMCRRSPVSAHARNCHSRAGPKVDAAADAGHCHARTPDRGAPASSGVRGPVRRADAGFL